MLSGCVGDFCEIFAPVEGFSGMVHRMLPIGFFSDRPRCHGNEIWNIIGYNSACVRVFCAYRGVFEDAPSNAANCIFRPLVMTIKPNYIRRYNNVSAQKQLKMTVLKVKERTPQSYEASPAIWDQC